MRRALALGVTLLIGGAVLARAADGDEAPSAVLTGVVTGKGAGPLEGVSVSVLGNKNPAPPRPDEFVGTGPRYRGPYRLATGTTDADGVFRLEGVPERPLVLTLDWPERGADYGPFDPADGPIEIELDVGGVIRGRLLAVDGRGVPRVLVRAMAQGEPFSSGEATTGTDGEFVITGLARDRDHALTTTVLPHVPTADARPRAADPVAARSDGADVVWRTAVGRGADGIVVDTSGEPVPDARLWFVHKGADVPGQPVLDRFGGPSCPTDRHGRFRIAPLADGRYRIGVEVGDRLQPVETRGGDDVVAGARDLRLVVDTAGQVEGRVTGPNNRPVQATVWAYPSEPSVPYRQTGSSAQDARYVVGGLDVRYAYDLVFFRPGLPPVVRTRVRVGQRNVDARLGRGESVSGRVVLASGRPVAHMPVSATLFAPKPDYGTPAQEDVTDVAGRFEITGLPEGEIRIEVAVSDGTTLTTGQALVQAGDQEVQLIVTVERQ